MIKVYSIDYCPRCKTLKEKLNQNKIEYVELNIDHNNEARAFIISKGLSAMPIIQYGNDFISGEHAANIDIEELR